MSNYYHRTKAKIANRDTGYTNTVWLASKSDFTKISEPTAPFTNPGDSLRITEDHTFPTGKGFVELLTTPDTVDSPGETAGDVGSKKTIFTTAAFLPGDGPDIQEMAQELLNDEVILLLKDANCPDNKVIQYGCDCKPAKVDSANFTSGTTATEGRKGWLLSIKSSCRWWYEGTITLQTP